MAAGGSHASPFLAASLSAFNLHFQFQPVDVLVFSGTALEKYSTKVHVSSHLVSPG
jgi:hypothetical protein